MRRRALLPLLLLALAGPAAAQDAPKRGTVELRVTDARTGSPVPAAEVLVNGRVAAHTDGAGGAVVTVPRAGGYPLRVKRIGYRTEALEVRVGKGQLALEVQLEPAPLALAAVTATASRRDADLEGAGFYDRMRVRGRRSTFITREEIDARRPARLTDLLSGVPGARVVQHYPVDETGSVNRRHFLSDVVVTTRYTTQLNDPSARPCLMRVFLDGAEMEPTQINLIRPEVLAGLEIYTGPSDVPIEYNGTGSACGALLLWTRTRT